MRHILLAATLAIVALTPAGAAHAGDQTALAADARKALEHVVAGPHRSAANRARDQYRHPVETLTFFGVKPSDTVVECGPGGGWYTEILAPYLAEHGKLVAASLAGKSAEGMRQASRCQSSIVRQGCTVRTFRACSAAPA